MSFVSDAVDGRRIWCWCLKMISSSAWSSGARRCLRVTSLRSRRAQLSFSRYHSFALPLHSCTPVCLPLSLLHASADVRFWSGAGTRPHNSRSARSGASLPLPSSLFARRRPSLLSASSSSSLSPRLPLPVICSLVFASFRARERKGGQGGRKDDKEGGGDHCGKRSTPCAFDFL